MKVIQSRERKTDSTRPWHKNLEEKATDCTINKKGPCLPGKQGRILSVRWFLTYVFCVVELLEHVLSDHGGREVDYEEEDVD